MSSLKIFIPHLLQQKILFSQKQMIDVIRKKSSEILYFDVTQVDFLELLNAPKGIQRTCTPAHFTTSCLLFNATATHTLLVLHKKYKEWVNPGGHADGDWFWLRSALRECFEETGVDHVTLSRSNCTQHPDDILDATYLLPNFVQKFDVAAFADMEAHAHFDVVYVLQTDFTEVRFDPNESLAIQWFEVETLKRIAEGAPTPLPLSQLTAKVILRGLQTLPS